MFYPLFLSLVGEKCLVVGAGKVAARKAASLARCKADVYVVGEKVCDEMRELIDGGKARHVGQRFAEDQLEGAALVFGATDSVSVNREVYDQARKLGIPVNVVDDLDLCSFIVPSVVRRGDLSIAISSSGKSPAVTKRLRKRLEEEFGDEWGIYVEIMGEAREKAKQSSEGQKTREKIFNELADSDILAKIKAGDIDGAKRLAREIIAK
ncbi:hypothetical protein MNBD_NITROSPINAE02-1357 [hydrothermal vent metagenome]|uniref:precorrin-2 dehydrogenase n=1 Tax=hydrothermal vent metagenome TaxID=652676 RepID=A0A3B1DBY9_9ZZZZ